MNRDIKIRMEIYKNIPLSRFYTYLTESHIQLKFKAHEQIILIRSYSN